jgi:N-acetylmuramic acid 6-phosphate etherase
MPETNPLFEQLKELTTEQRNPRTRRIDLAPTAQILELMNDEDATVAAAVRRSSPAIASAVELVTAAFHAGGRLFYAGAGTSGRLGILDAAECPPTFGVEPDLVQGIIAGGRETVFRSREGVEDRESAGAEDVAAHGVTQGDVLVGIAASRRTPYVLGALRAASGRGAKTVFLRCNDGPSPEVDAVITVVVGPEAITGSTRLKAARPRRWCST